MGFYATRILPRLLDLSMRNKRLMPYRQQTISAATGAVLEVGVGSGLNLPLYGDADWVCGIEPSGAVLDYARLQRTEGGLPVLLARASAEDLPFADSRFNTVVTTWTLCARSRGRSTRFGKCGASCSPVAGCFSPSTALRQIGASHHGRTA